MQPGMVAVDVGANEGSYSRAFLEGVLPGGAVVAIEPDPRMVPALKGIDGLAVIEAAVADTEGDAVLYLSHQAAQSTLYPANVLDPRNETATVRQVTLDGLQARGEIPATVHVLKIDAQGADYAILCGARQMLTTQRPVIYVESWAQGLAEAGASVADMGALLRQYDYVPIDARGWADLEADTARQTGHGSHDWLVIPAGSRV